MKFVKMFLLIFLGYCLCLVLATHTHADERTWTASVGAGADLNGQFNAITVSSEWLPRTPDLSWGVVTYLQAGPYDYQDGSGISVAAGVEPVVTMKLGPVRVSAGMGLALNNTTPHLGTPVNFSSVFMVEGNVSDNWTLRLQARHLSHAASLGLAEDKSNGGTTVVGLQGVYTF